MSDRRRLNGIARALGWENEQRRRRERDGETMKMAGLEITASPDGRVVTINGMRFAASFFELMHQPTPEGIWLRVTHVDNGKATFEQRTDLVPRGELDSLKAQNLTLRELFYRETERNTRPLGE